MTDLHHTVSLRPAPGVGLCLYPRRNGTHRDWVVTPYMVEWYQHLYDNDDSTFLVASVVGQEFTVGIDPVLLPVCAPHRIQGLTIRFRARALTVGGAVQAVTRIGSRAQGLADEVVCDSAGFYWYTSWMPVNPWSGRRWTSADLLDRSFEVGIVLTAGTVRVSEFSVSVAVEPVPARAPLVNAGGRYSDWTTYPAGSQDYLDLVRDNGDLSYITGGVGDQHTVRLEGDILQLPSNFQIDKVSLTTRSRGTSTLQPLVVDDAFNRTGPQGDWDLPQTTTWRTHTVPFYGRPRFTSGVARWDIPALQAAEFGVYHAGSVGSTDCSQLQVEVFASLVPEEVIRIRPTVNGSVNMFTVIQPNTGESAWEDVSTSLPDDTTFLRGTVTDHPQIQLFQCGNDYTNNWYGARLRLRVRTTPGYTGPSRIAPILTVGRRTYVGREFQVTNQATWSEVCEDYWLNPSDGRPWASTGLQNIEIGVVVVSGSVELSWCVLDAGTVPPRAHEPDPTVTDFTADGSVVVARAVADSVVWVVDKFEVGRGGFQRDNPAVVLPLEVRDSTLSDPVWSGPVAKSSSDGYTVTYWCPVPPEAISEPIGELMLWARILSSANPADIVGSYFPLTVMHFPAGFHTTRSIRVLEVQVTYAAPELSGYGFRWVERLMPSEPGGPSYTHSAMLLAGEKVFLYADYQGVSAKMWLWDGVSDPKKWTDVTASGPVLNNNNWCWCYDIARGLIVLIIKGGYPLCEVWELDPFGMLWMQRADVSGWIVGICYDPTNEVCIAVDNILMGHSGGLASTFTYDSNQLWTKVLNEDGPPYCDRNGVAPYSGNMGRGSLAFDEARGVAVLLNDFTDDQGHHHMEIDGVWEWAVGDLAWTLVIPSGLLPRAREDYGLCYSAKHGGVVLFGGNAYVADEDTEDLLMGDTWLWDGASFTPLTDPLTGVNTMLTVDAYTSQEIFLCRADPSIVSEGPLAGGRVLLYGGRMAFQLGNQWALATERLEATTLALRPRR